ncbi:MAG: 16S rRNA (adenine(1518)-N(6)/adenine(1519)-N(6))-dimethyltransferase RsmA [Pseudomonadota bacterium]|nr:16S rRNA (adenine(1518)-N(6)/adenine(1519)-N(6))-dimethyltransferase RsmA [Pseudomonadota bacterium]
MSDGLPPLREVIARYDLGARKALGQHFLLDLNLTRKIARAAEAGPADRFLEIGPGPGGLTRALLETGAEVIAIERDARCLEALADIAGAYPGKLTVIEGDALAADERALVGDAPVKIAANLPYNISTELLIKWLRTGGEQTPLWSRMALMFQKEVADRILAAPGSKTYGRLSVIAQAASRPSRAFDLPARAFTPPPKVDSSVLVFSPLSAPLVNMAALERLTQAAFSQRRKMLRQSLKSLWGGEVEARLERAGVKATDRAENVSVQKFIELAAG